MVFWGIGAALVGFFFVFGAGPLIYVRIIRRSPTLLPWRLLAVAAFLWLGFWLREGQALVDVLAVLSCLWAAWLLACAALMLALSGRLYGARRRWAPRVDAGTTTAPWFGFAASRLMGG